MSVLHRLPLVAARAAVAALAVPARRDGGTRRRNPGPTCPAPDGSGAGKCP
ncbi:MAG TPA: hypothetical protein VHK47_08260 [Polyangia bacterium]|nr:hypothetical protein [Polyangia bacterium]